MKALARFLFNLYRPNGYLLISPFLIAAGGIQLAANVLPRVIGANKRRQRAEEAGNTFKTPQGYQDAVNEAEGLSNNGDPNTSLNQDRITQAQSNTVARAKAVSGNVGEILSVLSSANKTASNATLSNMAADTAFRLNAKRYLTQAKVGKAAADANTASKNFTAKNAEINRQQQTIQGWAQAGGNIASDVASYGLMKEYGYMGGKGGMPPVFRGKQTFE